MNAETHFDAISRLNELWGRPRGELAKPHWGHTKLQVELIREEVAELIEAMQTGSPISQRKELCDVLVVSYGLAHILGHDIDLDTEWHLLDHDTLATAAVHNAAGHLEAMSQETLVSGSINSIMNTVCLMPGCAKPDFQNSLANLNRDLILLCYELGAFLGFDLDADMAAVQASNESKFCRNSEELTAARRHWESLGLTVAIEGQAPEIIVKSATNQADINGKTYPAGKVLKPTHYHEPEFAA